MTTPRFIECIKHDLDYGNLKEYKWDSTKITVEESLADDFLLLQNVFEGQIISPHIYPLIYDSKCEIKEISLRSLEFYREVLNDQEIFKLLPANEKLHFMIGVRDLFVASCRNLLSSEETELLKAMVGLIDSNQEDVIKKRIQNLDVTPYPTSQNKLVKFVEYDWQTFHDEFFIRNELGLLMVFVDPGHLTYHNFENIINLDSLFTNTQKKFIIQNFKKMEESEIYTFDMQDKSSVLLSLDKYGLYIPPFNSLSRGGQRFIFSSESLSRNLTECIQKFIPDKALINNKFRFVNYIFRYNKFKPNDKKFASHLDTPYHDPSRRHYSKYTILFYLTSGAADPVLSINQGQVKITDINTKNGIQGVIFDQKYEHEGKSFIDSDKIFLRSELVFEYEENELNFDDSISKEFNIACYMTKQSVFNPELEKYASDCFNHVAAARCGYNSDKFEKKFKHLLLLKKYEEVWFMTNGYDYWFTKDISLDDAAMWVLLDHFNYKFDTKDSFNRLTYTEEASLKRDNVEEIFEVLINPNKGFKTPSKNSKEKEETKVNLDVKTKLEKSEDDPNTASNYLKTHSDFCSMELEENQNDDLHNLILQKSEEHCCHYHNNYNYEYNHSPSESTFNPEKSEGLIKFYQEKKTLKYSGLEKLNDEFPIVIFDKQIIISKKNIEITDKSIIFKNQIPLIHFAAGICWVHGEKLTDAFVGMQKKEAVTYTNIPPIDYRTYEKGYHLRIELFNNKFLRKEKFDLECPFWIHKQTSDKTGSKSQKKKKQSKR